MTVLATLAVAWLVSQVSPAWTTRYLGVLLGPMLLIAALGLARAGALGLVALVIILGDLGDPALLRARRTSRTPPTCATRPSPSCTRATWSCRCSPSRDPLLAYHLEDLGGLAQAALRQPDRGR